MSTKIALATLVLGSVLLPTSAYAAPTNVAINFDTGMAPCSFRATSPLRDEYAKFGLRFGDGAGRGGKVLDQCARLYKTNQVVPAHSHRQYLVFDKARAGTSGQQITMTTLRHHAEIWVSTGYDYDPNPTEGAVQWDLVAYRHGQEVASGGALNASPSWIALPMDVPGGFDALNVSCYNCIGAWVMDDLKVSG